jgi:hypothetical protein
VVDAEQLVVDDAFDDVEDASASEQHPEMSAPRRRPFARLPGTEDQQHRERRSGELTCPRGRRPAASVMIEFEDPRSDDLGRRRPAGAGPRQAMSPIRPTAALGSPDPVAPAAVGGRVREPPCFVAKPKQKCAWP